MAGVLAFALATPSAVAQVLPPSANPAVPGRDRPVPDPGLPPTFDFTIQAPRRSPVPRAVEDLSFEVKDIRVKGATVYSSADLRPLLSPLIGKSARLADIVTVAERIEAKYRSDGYILTRAYVPAQSVSDGVFEIAVVEGYVTALAVEGADASTQARVQAMLAPVLESRPLKLSVIEAALLRANDLPGTQVSGLLRASPTEPGASELAVKVTAPLLVGAISADNRGAKITDRRTGTADAYIHSPFFDGGLTQLTFSSAPIFNRRHSFQGRYSAPVGTGGTIASLSGLVSHGQPAGAVAGLELVTDSVAAGPRLAHPLIVSRAHRLSVDGGLTFQSADVMALGLPFSHDEWRVLDVALTYQQNGFLSGLSSITFDVAKGINAFGSSCSGCASLSRSGGRPDFTKITTIARRVQSLGGPFSASALVSGQYAFNTLLLGEEISFGGSTIGRGYDPSTLTGDQGVGGAFELRYDIERVPPRLMDSAQLYTFYDVAKVWNREGPTERNRLASAGFGGRTIFSSSASFGLEFAAELNQLPTSNSGKRGNRILFNGAMKF
jgi:hemolysin activation/secretion protein